MKWFTFFVVTSFMFLSSAFSVYLPNSKLPKNFRINKVQILDPSEKNGSMCEKALLQLPIQLVSPVEAVCVPVVEIKNSTNQEYSRLDLEISAEEVAQNEVAIQAAQVMDFENESAKQCGGIRQCSSIDCGNKISFIAQALNTTYLD